MILMNRYLTPCVDSNQIKDLNVRCESMKLLKKTQGRFHSLALDGDSVAVAVPPKHKQPHRKGTNAVTANQTASAQEEQTMSERQPPDRGKIFANHKAVKKLIPKITHSLQLNKKKTTLSTNRTCI